MIETLIGGSEFEQNNHREVERKYIPLYPESFEDLRRRAVPIEQFYLSHPSEEFSLRLRERFEDGELRYSAALKDTGFINDGGLDRLEVETDLSSEVYRYYKPGAPTIRKLRAALNNNVVVDFYGDGTVLFEAEDPIAWAQVTERHGNHFMEVTGDRQADNEWLAHYHYARENGGKEAFVPKAGLDLDGIVSDVLSTHSRRPNVIVQIAGRSGSGKSTVVKELQSRLYDNGLGSNVLSTDDYHRGASWLKQFNGGKEWTDWDDPVVYDTASMARDIGRLIDGDAIPRRLIDFSVAEPHQNGTVQPADVLIIEGIYAAHPDFSQYYGLRYDMPTPLATCIGRRLLRDMKERPEFSDASTSLRYMLEQAEPMWRKQSTS